MQTHLQVLSEDERDQIHEHTLGILARTGVRVFLLFMPLYRHS